MTTTPRSPLARPLLLALALAAPAAAGDVHVVDVNGGGDFTLLQAAVNAAADGDTLLVRPGLYGDLTIDGKNLSVRGDPGRFRCGRVTVVNLPAGGEVHVSRARGKGALTVYGCTGRVLLEKSLFQGRKGDYSSGESSVVYSSADVVLVDCTLIGGQGGDSGCIGPGSPGGSGLYVSESTVVAYHCALTGGEGGRDTCDLDDGCGDGGAGLQAPTGSVFLDHCDLEGGAGGSGWHCYGDDGPDIAAGPGVVVHAAHDQVRLLSSRVLHPGQPVNVAVRGTPGHQVWLVRSEAMRSGRWLPPEVGVLHLDDPEAPRALGPIPGSGELRATVPGWLLEQGEVCASRYLQVVVVDSAGNRYLGNPVGISVVAWR